MSELGTQHNKLVEGTKIIDKQTTLVSNAAMDFIIVLKEIWAHDTNQFDYYLTFIFKHLGHLLASWTDIDTAKKNQRLPETLLTSQQYTDLQTGVNNGFKQHDRTSWISTPGDLKKLTATYTSSQQNGLVINIKIPCYDQKEVMTLYKYIPLPTPLHRCPQGSGQCAIYINSKYQYIAVGDGNHTVILLEDYKVNECKQLVGIKVCPGLQQLSTGQDENSCLGSLFLHDGKGVNLHCEQQTKRFSEEIIDLEDGHYYILSAAEVNTQMVCPTDVWEYTNPAFTQRKLYIPPGCTFKTKTATLRGYKENSNEKVFINLFQSLELDSSILKDIKTLQEEVSIINKASKEVEEQKTKLNSTEIDWDSMLDHNLPFNYFIPIIVAECVVVIIAVLYFIIVFTKCERIE